MPTIQVATDVLHIAFGCLNQRFFNNEIPEPAITIQSSGKRLSMGWCTNDPIWKDRKGTIKKFEINIGAEFLNIDFYETMNTLLHEMVHLYCTHNQIKDTSRGNTYHNKHFKEQSIQHGFYYEMDKPDKKYGWSFSKLTEESKRIIDTFPINHDVFQIARDTYGVLKEEDQPTGAEEKEKEKRHNTKKWICPTCKISVRSTKIVKIMCSDCMETMEEEIK